MKNKLCACGCGQKVKVGNRYINGHNRPWIGKHLSQDHKIKISNNRQGRKLSDETKLKMSKSRIGSKHSEETLKKMRGQKRSLETRRKISKALMGHHVSDETKKKMSISTIKYISDTVFNGGPAYPRNGRNENQIIERLEQAVNLEFLKNDYELALKIGKFMDAYIPKYNLDVEILESHHFNIDGTLSDYDKDRELLISSRLSCMIYYIPESSFLSNPRMEIQRFKDFISILDESRN